MSSRGARSAVMTVTPVANVPRTRRKNSGVGVEADIEDGIEDSTESKRTKSGKKVGAFQKEEAQQGIAAPPLNHEMKQRLFVLFLVWL